MVIHIACCEWVWCKELHKKSNDARIEKMCHDGVQFTLLFQPRYRWCLIRARLLHHATINIDNITRVKTLKRTVLGEIYHFKLIYFYAKDDLLVIIFVLTPRKLTFILKIFSGRRLIRHFVDKFSDFKVYYVLK